MYYMVLGSEGGFWEVIKNCGSSYFDTPELAEKFLKEQLANDCLTRYDFFRIMQTYKEYDVCIKRELVES